MKMTDRRNPVAPGPRATQHRRSSASPWRAESPLNLGLRPLQACLDLSGPITYHKGPPSSVGAPDAHIIPGNSPTCCPLAATITGEGSDDGSCRIACCGHTKVRSCQLHRWWTWQVLQDAAVMSTPSPAEWGAALLPTMPIPARLTVPHLVWPVHWRPAEDRAAERAKSSTSLLCERSGPAASRKRFSRDQSNSSSNSSIKLSTTK